MTDHKPQTTNTFSGKSTKDINVLLSGLAASTNPLTARHIIGNLDYTSLNVTDNKHHIESICEKLNNYNYIFPDLPQVAAVCVYPKFIPVLKKQLSVAGIKIASVSAAFPSSQTFLKIRLDETRMAVGEGADEIDMVMSIGEFLAGNKSYINDEIAELKEICGDKHLKVILETGVLNKPELIYEASTLAMEAGADFIKTSTGKEKISASLEAVYVMCQAVKNFHLRNKKMVGIKPAGGISETGDAIAYYSLIETTLGKSWLAPEYFRIGASRLANNLLNTVEGRNVDYF